jgi:hypothetical protein
LRFKKNETVETATMSLSQDGESSDYVPCIGMNFETDEEAYKLYNDYALIVGFSTVKSGMYTSRNKKNNWRGYEADIQVQPLWGD